MVEKDKDKALLVWGKRAYTSLQNAYKMIREDSPVNAEKVRDDIFKITRELAKHPEK